MQGIYIRLKILYIIVQSEIYNISVQPEILCINLIRNIKILIFG